MFPEVRVYEDPFEGMSVQLTELRGLIRIVPPLIDADRQRRWEEISSRPSDGEDGDVIDVYETEAGAEEGWGHARFDRTIYVAAVVTAWAVFHDFLSRQLRKQFLDYDLSDHDSLAVLRAAELKRWDRQFEAIVNRYDDFGGVKLRQLPSWSNAQHAQELRNALVHNQGQYTERYLRAPHAHVPTEEDEFRLWGDRDVAELVDQELIPLSFALVDDVIQQLMAAAAEIRQALVEA